MSERKKIFFASDLHLGVPDAVSSLKREKLFVSWLTEIEHECAELFLLGDIFDFWFEYKKVVPAGYVRLLGKLASFSDNGIPITLFIGNHDLWVRNYLQNELGIRIVQDYEIKSWFGKKYFISHGDGLGPGDEGYKFLKKVFRNPFLQWSFRQIHPDTSFRIAEFFSKKSRNANLSKDRIDYGSKEMLYQFSMSYKHLNPEVDYFVFGHRHLPGIKPLEGFNCSYINTGDWIRYNSYLVIDEKGPELLYYKP